MKFHLFDLGYVATNS